MKNATMALHQRINLVKYHMKQHILNRPYEEQVSEIEELEKAINYLESIEEGPQPPQSFYLMENRKLFKAVEKLKQELEEKNNINKMLWLSLAIILIASIIIIFTI